MKVSTILGICTLTHIIVLHELSQFADKILGSRSREQLETNVYAMKFGIFVAEAVNAVIAVIGVYLAINNITF